LRRISTGVVQYGFRPSDRPVRNDQDGWNTREKGKFFINLNFCLRNYMTNRQFSSMMGDETSRMAYHSLGNIKKLFELWYLFLWFEAAITFWVL
jgi:hypothetical protein